MTPTITDALAGRPYPGRVCLAAVTHDAVPLVGYALTGRSEGSRARSLSASLNGDIEVIDTSGGPRDALRHYTALARRRGWLVLGNGDQVVPIAEALAGGHTEREAWAEHTFEPDPPIWTPRIWLVKREGSSEVVLGWARRAADGHPHRGLLAVDNIEPGHGLLLTTYEGTAKNVHGSARPLEVEIPYLDAASLGTALWAVLDPDLRVGAVTNTEPWTDAVLRRVPTARRLGPERGTFTGGVIQRFDLLPAAVISPQVASGDPDMVAQAAIGAWSPASGDSGMVEHLDERHGRAVD